MSFEVSWLSSAYQGMEEGQEWHKCDVHQKLELHLWHNWMGFVPYTITSLRTRTVLFITVLQVPGSECSFKETSEQGNEWFTNTKAARNTEDSCPVGIKTRCYFYFCHVGYGTCAEFPCFSGPQLSHWKRVADCQVSFLSYEIASSFCAKLQAQLVDQHLERAFHDSVTTWGRKALAAGPPYPFLFTKPSQIWTQICIFLWTAMWLLAITELHMWLSLYSRWTDLGPFGLPFSFH